MVKFVSGKLTFYYRALKSRACVAFVPKTVEEIRITIFLISFRENKVNAVVVSTDKLNNFVGLVTCNPGSDMTAGRCLDHSEVLDKSYKGHALLC